MGWFFGFKRTASHNRNAAQHEKPSDAHMGKALLRKMCIIETLFDKLKSQMGLEHTRHSSPNKRIRPHFIIGRI